MKRFLVDNQLPEALAQWLRDKGCVAQHVLDLQLAQSPDELIWQRAAEGGFVIISKDEDFAHLTVMRSEFVQVVWLRVGNCRTAALLATLKKAWPALEQQLETGARLVEVW